MADKTAPKKRGRKPILDAVAVAAALTELQGNVMATAKRFGVARQSVQDLITRTPSLKAVVHDAREGMKDHGESSLYRAVIKGEAWAVCFYLKTQAKDRGYIEKTEQETTHRGEVNVNVSKQPEPPSSAVLAILDRLGLPAPGSVPEPIRKDGGSEPVDTARSNGKAGHLPSAG